MYLFSSSSPCLAQLPSWRQGLLQLWPPVIPVLCCCLLVPNAKHESRICRNAIHPSQPWPSSSSPSKDLFKRDVLWNLIVRHPNNMSSPSETVYFNKCYHVCIPMQSYQFTTSLLPSDSIYKCCTHNSSKNSPLKPLEALFLASSSWPAFRSIGQYWPNQCFIKLDLGCSE